MDAAFNQEKVHTKKKHAPLKWLRKNIIGLICLAVFMAGAAFLIYPQFSNWWNQLHQSRAIDTYTKAVEGIDPKLCAKLLGEAETYNEEVRTERANGSMVIEKLSDAQKEVYNSLLDNEGTGMMAYVEIPKIHVKLPIYHGTDDGVLQTSIGHLEGTSLPVGGKGTHTVLSGHRGLPSAKLFTELDAMGEGDVFTLTVLNRTITYQVDQIVTVLPNQLDELAIDPGQDYATLVTCTPYGINTHRLLVRGHRIPNMSKEEMVNTNSAAPEHQLSMQEQVQKYIPYLLVAAAIFFVIALFVPKKKKGTMKKVGSDSVKDIQSESHNSRQ